MHTSTDNRIVLHINERSQNLRDRAVLHPGFAGAGGGERRRGGMQNVDYLVLKFGARGTGSAGSAMGWVGASPMSSLYFGFR